MAQGSVRARNASRHIVCAALFLACAAPACSENEPPPEHSVFPEKELTGLEWGMSPESFRAAYTRSPEVVEPVAGLLQDVSLPIYGLETTAGFEFGSKGLRAVIASFLFVQKDQRLDQAAVLSHSKSVLARLEQLHGPPDITMPWDGRKLNHVWLGRDTVVQFAWDGANAWGVHLRSVALDPVAQAIIQQLK